MNESRRKICQYLLDGIVSEKFKSGDRLPTEKELSRKFSTNRLNAHYAIHELGAMNMVMRNKRGGTVLTGPIEKSKLRRLRNSISSRICILNHTPKSYLHLRWNDLVMEELSLRLKADNIVLEYHDMSEVDNSDAYCAKVNELISGGVAALLIIAGSQSDHLLDKYPELLFKLHHNVFILESGSQSWDKWNYNVVGPNNFNDGARAAEYLREQGCTAIYSCELDSAVNSFWQTQRSSGVLYGCAKSGINNIVAAKFTLGELKLDLLTQPSVGIVTANDAVAAELIDRAAEVGLKVGREFKLVSFDNDPRYAEYNLTSFTPDMKGITEALAELISKTMFNHSHTRTTTIKIDSKLIQRSTA
jgi:DNA-binding LacI/PurR family transcriptional regulator